jgi:uncharacterized protein YebE (UPF0316 family)
MHRRVIIPPSRALVAELKARRKLLDRIAMVTVAFGLVGVAAAGLLIARPSLDGALGVVLPLLVVAGLRTTDVTLGVFRTAFIVAGRRGPAAAAAATEAIVWVSATGIVLADMSPARLGAFAVGVAAGTLVGIQIVRALRLGMVTVRMFVPGTKGDLVAEALRADGYRATVFDGRGRDGHVTMILAVMRRREARLVVERYAHDPDVFTTIDSDPGPASVVSGKVGAAV